MDTQEIIDNLVRLEHEPEGDMKSKLWGFLLKNKTDPNINDAIVNWTTHHTNLEIRKVGYDMFACFVGARKLAFEKLFVTKHDKEQQRIHEYLQHIPVCFTSPRDALFMIEKLLMFLEEDVRQGVWYSIVNNLEKYFQLINLIQPSEAVYILIKGGKVPQVFVKEIFLETITDVEKTIKVRSKNF